MKSHSATSLKIYSDSTLCTSDFQSQPDDISRHTDAQHIKKHGYLFLDYYVLS